MKPIHWIAIDRPQSIELVPIYSAIRYWVTAEAIADWITLEPWIFVEPGGWPDDCPWRCWTDRPNWHECQTIYSEYRFCLAGDLAEWLHWQEVFPSAVAPSCGWLMAFQQFTFSADTS